MVILTIKIEGRGYMTFFYSLMMGMMGSLGTIGLTISNFFVDFNLLKIISSAIDIALVWFLIYKLLTLIQGTKAVQLLKGIAVIFLVLWLSIFFGLQTLNFIVDKIVAWGVLAIIIIFQPELRRALEQLGRGKFFGRIAAYKGEDAVQEEAIAKAVDYMAKRRIGALISIERQTGLDDYSETGIPLHAKTTTELLINIFIPNTPLHDGAVIIRKDEIVAASCYLPLSESQHISKELGTRHRAALGISEVTDSVTIVVSEETGNITLARNGRFHHNLTPEKLLELLKDSFQQPEKETSSSLASFWTRKVKRNE